MLDTTQVPPLYTRTELLDKITKNRDWLIEAVRALNACHVTGISGFNCHALYDLTRAIVGFLGCPESDTRIRTNFDPIAEQAVSLITMDGTAVDRIYHRHLAWVAEKDPSLRLHPEIDLALRHGRLVSAVRAVRDSTGLGLWESKTVCTQRREWLDKNFSDRSREPRDGYLLIPDSPTDSTIQVQKEF